MKVPKESKRRTVLKTIGAGVVGGTVLTGTAGAHGGGGRDFRVPVWFETQVWEMTSKPPHGPEPTDDNSHAPIWHIAPNADSDAENAQSKAQIPGLIDFSMMEDDPRFTGDWGTTTDEEGRVVPCSGVLFDQTASANPFSTLWHIHWVFDGRAAKPYEPADLVNEAVTTSGGSPEPLTSGSRIKDAELLGNVVVEDIPFVFNCPIRTYHGDHYFGFTCL